MVKPKTDKELKDIKNRLLILLKKVDKQIKKQCNHDYKIHGYYLSDEYGGTEEWIDSYKACPLCYDFISLSKE